MATRVAALLVPQSTATPVKVVLPVRWVPDAGPRERTTYGPPEPCAAPTEVKITEPMAARATASCRRLRILCRSTLVASSGWVTGSRGFARADERYWSRDASERCRSTHPHLLIQF